MLEFLPDGETGFVSNAFDVIPDEDEVGVVDKVEAAEETALIGGNVALN